MLMIYIMVETLYIFHNMTKREQKLNKRGQGTDPCGTPQHFCTLRFMIISSYKVVHILLIGFDWQIKHSLRSATRFSSQSSTILNCVKCGAEIQQNQTWNLWCITAQTDVWRVIFLLLFYFFFFSFILFYFLVFTSPVGNSSTVLFCTWTS